MFAAAVPTPNEQMFVELLNRARANPAQFAIDFRLPVPLTDAAAAPPLAINPYLTDSARGHALEMAAYNYVAHQSTVTGKWPNQMAREAGYPLPASWPNASNYIEAAAAGSYSSYMSATEPLKALLVDAGLNPPAHRLHLLGMQPLYLSQNEIGVGYANNPSSTYKNYWVIQTAYNESAPGKFLTGVAFNDSVIADNYYNVGEQLGGATITATRTTDGAVFSTTTFSSGGYSLALTPGTYNVTASGPGFASPVTVTGVVMGNVNVKRDFEPVAATPPVLASATFDPNTRQARFTYNTSISAASAAVGDLEVTNTATNVTTRPAMAVSVNGSSVTFTLPTNLANGNYRFRIPAAAITGTNGITTATSGDLSTFILAGDVNRDRVVNFDDLLIVAQNYGTSGRSFSHGDFNYDGLVNFDDLLQLAQHYGTSL